jgi:hypothetical protein
VPAPGRDQPRDVELRRGRHDVAEPLPDRGHRSQARGQPGVRGDDAREAVGVLGDEAQSDEPAPVLPHEHDVAQAQPLEERLPGPRDVPGVAVRGHGGGFVGAAEADQIGRDGADPGRGQHLDHPPVEEPPGRLPVQQGDDRAVGRACLDVRHPQPAVDLHGPGLVPEVREIGEPAIGGPEHVHVRSVADEGVAGEGRGVTMTDMWRETEQSLRLRAAACLRRQVFPADGRVDPGA